MHRCSIHVPTTASVWIRRIHINVSVTQDTPEMPVKQVRLGTLFSSYSNVKTIINDFPGRDKVITLICINLYFSFFIFHFVHELFPTIMTLE